MTAATLPAYTGDTPHMITEEAYAAISTARALLSCTPLTPDALGHAIGQMTIAEAKLGVVLHRQWVAQDTGCPGVTTAGVMCTNDPDPDGDLCEDCEEDARYGRLAVAS
jgi:hypothetical protein